MGKYSAHEVSGLESIKWMYYNNHNRKIHLKSLSKLPCVFTNCGNATHVSKLLCKRFFHGFKILLPVIRFLYSFANIGCY